MTDSEPDVLPNCVFDYQNGCEMMSIKGPNISRSFRNNTLTSKMDKPWNLDRPRYAQSVYDQQSVYSRRETSPMSLSVSGRQPHNFYNSYMNAGLYRDRRGPYIERSGSPMSVRTMDSTVSAIDLAAILNNQKFNKHEWRIIKEAVNKNTRNRLRKRVEKRRNLRLFLKGSRRRSGYDSGELGSDSSISSDDCRSTRTCRTAYNNNTFSCRSTITDVTDFRRTMKESNMYRDCTENFRQNTLKNMFQVGPRSAKENTLKPQNKLNNTSTISQQDRFKNGFLLPSQRFNQSGALMPIPEKENRLDRGNVEKNMFNTKGNGMNQKKRPGRHRSHETDSEQEEIFSEITSVDKSTFDGNSTQHKRSLDVDDDICVSKNKRNKLSPLQNKKPEPELTVPNKTNSSNQKKPNDFEFIKPQFPLKKLNNVKKIISKPQQSTQKLTSKSVKQTPEKLISKMSQPLDALEHRQDVQPLPHCNAQEKEQGEEFNNFSTTDMSMRPSFIKRKLFTQKIDDAESKNSSSDNLVESPQSNIYSAIQKEKNRTRKLVTTQSCLNRDVVGDDSNLLDLIHKIVPKDRMNTTAVNKSGITKTNKPADVGNKWDVTAVLSMCNEDDVSDTYTDEEIFQVNEQSVTTKKMNYKEDVQIETKTNKTSEKAKTMPQQNVKKCSVVLEKRTMETNNLTNVTIKSISPKVVNTVNKFKSPIGDTGLKNRNVYDRVKSFWDTDFESDIENEGACNWKSNLKDNHSKGTSIQNNVINQHSKKITSNIKPTSEITVLPNSKTKPKTVAKESGNNNGRKITAPEASNVSPPEEIKPASVKAKKKTTQGAPKVTPREQNKPTSVKTKTKTAPVGTPLEQINPSTSVKTKITKSVLPKVSPPEQNKPCQSVTRKKERTPKSPQMSPPDLKMKPPKSLKTKNKEDAMSSKKNDVTSLKKSIKKTASDKNNVISNNKGMCIKATNNNTLKVRPQGIESPKPEQSLNEKSEPLNKSLRSRIIDLSTSLVSDKTSTSEKIPAKKRGRPPKNKNITNISRMDNSRSDISFSITDKYPTGKPYNRVSALTKNYTGMKTRRSDVSFTLISDKTLNKTTGMSSRHKNICKKELESLQLSTSFFLRSSDNSFKRSLKKCR